MLATIKNIVVFLVFVNLVPQYAAIYDPRNVVTKPPIKKESLSWPNRNKEYETENSSKHEIVIETTKENVENFDSIHGLSSNNHPSKTSSSKNADRYTEPVNERSAARNQNSQPTWIFPEEHNADHHYRIKEQPATANDNFPSKWVFPGEDPPEEKNWDKSGWMPSQPCPEKATGQFPYPGDCKKFYNCWKGRGILQVCAPGTLFNPETLECDFPAKVRCLDSTTYYSPVPIVDNNGPDLSGGSRRSKSINAVSGHKPRQNFQQYQEYSSDHPAGHVGVQPPPHQIYNRHSISVEPEYPPVGIYPDHSQTDSQFICIEMPLNNGQPHQISYSSQAATHVSPNVQNNNQYQPPHSHNHHRQENQNGVKTSIPHHSQQREQNNEYSHPQYNYNNNMQQNGNPQLQVQNNQNSNVRTMCFNRTSLQFANSASNNQPYNFERDNGYTSSNRNYDQNPVEQPYPPQFPPLFKPAEHSTNNHYTPSGSNTDAFKNNFPANSNSYYNPNSPQRQFNNNNPNTPSFSQNGYVPTNLHNPNSNYPGNPPTYTNNQNTRYVNISKSEFNKNFQGKNLDQYQPVFLPDGNRRQFEIPQNTNANNYNPYNTFNPQTYIPVSSSISTNSDPHVPNFEPSSNAPNSQNPYVNPSDTIYLNHGANIPYNSDALTHNNGLTPQSLPSNQYDPSHYYPASGLPHSPNSSPHQPQPDTINAASQNNPNIDLNNQVKCPPGFSGLLPHPTICEKFLNCDHGTTFIQSCGPGTVFNPAFSGCDYPSKVNCRQRVSSEKSDLNNNNNNNGNDDLHSGTDDEAEKFGQETRHFPTWIYGSTVKPDNQDLNYNLRSGDRSIKPAENKPQSSWSPPYPSENPLATNIGLSNSTSSNHSTSNFRHPHLPGHYIVTNITTTSTTPETLTTTDEIQSIGDDKEENISSESPKPNLSALSQIYPKPITKAPVSRQIVRLRGGSKPLEGFLELQVSSPGWGIVCDKENSWTIEEANIVCKQLGYDRGAELTWQGRPSEGGIVALKTIAADMVNCTGKEQSLIDCQIEKDNTCDPERDSVWIRCFNNRLSYCRPNETLFDGKCYLLVIPRIDKKEETAGFSQAEALAHCQTNGGHLFDINSQKENDFISEWLLSQKTVSTIMTAGVGVSLMGRSLWIWEGSADTLDYHNWWPGWGQVRANPPTTYTGRGLCIVAKHQFPCPGSAGVKSIVENSLCDSEYFFWYAEDCGAMSSKHPYVCERKADKIGCIVGRGKDYAGPANVTETGTACLPWDSDLVLPALQYRISEVNRVKLLSKHNYCRNVGGADGLPWCFVRTKTGIKKENCDIPPCPNQGITGKSLGEEAFKCDDNQFACGLNDCIPSSWVCDGHPDCKNGLDESKCSKSLRQFTHYTSSKLESKIQEKWLHLSADNCANKCLQSKGFKCHSFSFNSKSDTCLLSETNIGKSGQLTQNIEDWEYYELTSLSVNCSEMHICDNKKCITKTMVCDGRNDCGDRSDERNCTIIDEGFEIRLVGGKASHEGRVEVKVLGEWGVICDDKFGMRDADVVCREIGFSLGASEVKLHSTFISQNSSKKFLVDDLNCRGNETSIRECDFNGWGVHDCSSEEVVGVVCQVPGAVCPPNYWQCPKTKDCIPVAFLCDNTIDCMTGDDEDQMRCNMGIEVRLVPTARGAGPATAGRLEVKRFGIWGTVCDDDFGRREAEVVCKSLGFNGDAEARKEAAFGPGDGIIWLDQVHCNGSEPGIDKCLHQQWGQSNCKHDEDVAVVCSNGSKTGKHHPDQKPQPKVIEKTSDVDLNSLAENILPQDCGTLDDNLDLLSSDFTPKVVAGHEVQKGTFPWQASIRVRTSIKSVHWCGAVVISPLHILTAGHCLLDYNKDVYFVRVGDHDAETEDGSEQEADIEELYLHDEFNKGPRLNNDLALIKLKGRGLQLNTWVRPVCLPTSSVKYNPGINCSVSGWGTNGIPGAGYARLLHAVFAPILPQDECTADYVYGKSSISEGMFCAGSLEGGADSCQGDSGGPYICNHKGRFTLYGITSWGHGCGKSNKPGVYTKISSYISWLKKKVHDSMAGL